MPALLPGRAGFLVVRRVSAPRKGSLPGGKPHDKQGSRQAENEDGDNPSLFHGESLLSDSSFTKKDTENRQGYQRAKASTGAAEL